MLRCGDVALAMLLRGVTRGASGEFLATKKTSTALIGAPTAYGTEHVDSWDASQNKLVHCVRRS